MKQGKNDVFFWNNVVVGLLLGVLGVFGILSYNEAQTISDLAKFVMACTSTICGLIILKLT